MMDGKSRLIHILVCTACLAVGCTQKDMGPAEAVLKAFNCLQVNDVDAFMDTFDMPQSDRADMHAVCDSTICKSIASRGGIVSVKVADETLSEDGKKATVTVDVSYSDGSVSNIVLLLENRGGRWIQKLTI